MLVGSLGKIIFVVSSHYIKTIDELKFENSVTYAEHQILKRKPKLEFLSENLKTASFNIQLKAIYNVNPLAAAKELNDYMVNGTVVRFIMGIENKGKFVITSLKENHKHFSQFGTVSAIDLEVNIKEYH